MAQIESEYLKKIKKIALASKRLVQKDLLGDYKSAFRGTGMQFSEFRQYVYGDDVRHIAWNASAKTVVPLIKIFEEERERSMLLLVDVSGSLRHGNFAHFKAERLTEIAATLALSAFEAKDKLGLILFSDKIERVVPPASGKTHLLRVIRDVLFFEPQSSNTNPDIALAQVERLLKKRSVVFFLSDMEKSPSLKTIKRCARKHELIALMVDNPSEYQLPKSGFVEMISAEEGRPITINTRWAPFRKYLANFFTRHNAEAEELFRKSGSDLIKIDIDDDYVPILRKYFKQRGKRKRKSA